MPGRSTMPTNVAIRPSTRVLAIAALSSGHTGRLPLMRPAPVERDEVAAASWKYCDTRLPGEAVGLLVLLDLRLAGPRVEPQVALHRIGADANGDEDENVMMNSVGMVHSSRRTMNLIIVPHLHC